MSCCGSLFVNLGGGGGGTIATGVLQIAGGVALDNTLRFVEDQNGTDSPLKLNTTEVLVNSKLTINNTLEGSTSGRMNIIGQYDMAIVSGNSAGGAGGVFFGGSSAAPQARVDIVGDGTNPILRFANPSGEQGNISNSGKLTIKEVEVETGFTAKYNSTKIIEAVQVSGSTGLGFFAAPAIVQPTTSIANATYANVSGTEIKENDTFDGYTVGQVVQALRNLGLLA